MDFLIVAVVLAILLQVADFATTYFVIKNGGSELNGLVKMLMDMFGLVGGLIVSKGVGIGLVYFMYSLTIQDPEGHNLIIGVLTVLNIIYGVVIANNIKAVKKTIEKLKAQKAK